MINTDDEWEDDQKTPQIESQIIEETKDGQQQEDQEVIEQSITSNTRFYYPPPRRLKGYNNGKHRAGAQRRNQKLIDRKLREQND